MKSSKHRRVVHVLAVAEIGSGVEWSDLITPRKSVGHLTHLGRARDIIYLITLGETIASRQHGDFSSRSGSSEAQQGRR